jgi:hypothetical protein
MMQANRDSMVSQVLEPTRGPWKTLLIRCALAFVALSLVQWVLLPGFLAMDVPSHSDLWRYYAVAHELGLRDVLTSPRPLMLLFLHLLAPVNNAHIFFVLLNIPVVLFVSCGLMAGERLTGLRVGSFVAFSTFLLLFSTSTFYELNPLDFGGMLAGVFVSALVFRLCIERDRVASGQRPRLMLSAAFIGLLTYVSIETKPTFAALLPFLPLILLRRHRIKAVVLLCIVCVAFILLSVIKDVWLKSPFIQVGGGDSPYKVGSNPLDMVSAAYFYLGGIVPRALLPLFIFLLYRTWRVSRMYAGIAVIASILAVLPMVAIPARLLQMYSWFGLAISAFVLVPYISWRSSGSISKVVLLVLGSIGLLTVALGSRSDARVIDWVATNHRFNKEVFKGLEDVQIRMNPRERLLVTGPMLPFNPFSNDSFIEQTSPVKFTWSVVYPKSEAALVKMSNDSKVHIPLGAVDLSDFDKVAIFDLNGRLSQLAPAGQFVGLSSYDLAARFFCSSALTERDEETQLLKVVLCLNQLGEFAAASSYAQEHGPDTRNQWVWYGRGQANESLGRLAEAEAAYRRAASLEKAAVFDDAVRRVQANEAK